MGRILIWTKDDAQTPEIRSSLNGSFGKAYYAIDDSGDLEEEKKGEVSLVHLKALRRFFRQRGEERPYTGPEGF